MKKVITFGTFDHFHAGHESYLKQAKEHGDYLITIIARDKTVKNIKGKAPTHNEKQRLSTLKKSKIADKVVLGENDDKYSVIRHFKPAIIALGYDQFAFTFSLKKFLIDHKLDAKIVRLKPYKASVYKSSLIREAAEKNPNYGTQLLLSTAA